MVKITITGHWQFDGEHQIDRQTVIAIANRYALLSFRLYEIDAIYIELDSIESVEFKLGPHTMGFFGGASAWAFFQDIQQYLTPVIV